MIFENLYSVPIIFLDQNLNCNCDFSKFRIIIFLVYKVKLFLQWNYSYKLNI